MQLMKAKTIIMKLTEGLKNNNSIICRYNILKDVGYTKFLRYKKHLIILIYVYGSKIPTYN